MNVIKFMANQDDVVKMHYVQTLQALLLVSVRPDTLATQRPNVLMLMNVPDLMHVVVGLLVKTYRDHTPVNALKELCLTQTPKQNAMK